MNVIKKESITLSDNGYVADVTVTGKLDNDSRGPGFFINELQQLNSLSVLYSINPDKWKKLKEKNIMISDIHTGSFVTGYKKVHFKLPPGVYYQYRYNISGPDLFFLSSLSFNEEGLNMAYYDITIPNHLDVLFDTVNLKKKGIEYSTDSTADSKIHFLSFNKTSDNAKEILPDVLLIIFPKKLNSEDTCLYCYLSNWYNNLLSGIPHLSDSSMNEILAHIDTSCTDSILSTSLRYVQSAINYIDIENGIGAFQPRDPNVILNNKKGDCKDMSFLLHKILEVLGIKSYLALSSTLDHFYDMDFPSLASANHVVCAVPLSNGFIILDATDPFSTVTIPSQHIQGKKILVAMENHPVLYRAPVIEAAKNQVCYTINLDMDSMKGHLQIGYSGMAARPFRYNIRSHTAAQSTLMNERHLKNTFRLADLKNINIINSGDSISISAHLQLNKSAAFEGNTVTYISLESLPKPWDITSIDKDNLPIQIYRTSETKIRCLYRFSRNVTVKNIDQLKLAVAGEDIEFYADCIQTSGKELEINYIFRFNNVEINKDNFESVFKTNNTINEFLKSHIQIY